MNYAEYLFNAVENPLRRNNLYSTVKKSKESSLFGR